VKDDKITEMLEDYQNRADYYFENMNIELKNKENYAYLYNSLMYNVCRMIIEVLEKFKNNP